MELPCIEKVDMRGRYCAAESASDGTRRCRGTRSPVVRTKQTHTKKQAGSR